MSTNKNDKTEIAQKIQAMKERELKEPEIQSAQAIANVKMQEMLEKQKFYEDVKKGKIELIPDPSSGISAMPDDRKISEIGEAQKSNQAEAKQDAKTKARIENGRKKSARKDESANKSQAKQQSKGTSYAR